MNNNGQITLEYILIMGIIIIIMMSTIQTLNTQSEKNIILAAAHTGAQIGVDKNSYAMYYNDTVNNYAINHPQLLYPIEIKIIKINMSQEEEVIFLQAQLSSNNYLTLNQKEIISQRVNYYIRKTVAETFNQKNADLFYENVKSENYNIKTKKVRWS